MSVRPVIIRDEDCLAALLRGRREALGISQGDLDHKVGWPDGYTAKVEAPNRGFGRRVAWGLSHLLAYWLEALGLALVVMDRTQAAALIEASTDPEMTSVTHRVYPGRDRKRPVVQRKVLRFGITFAPRKAA